MDDGHDSFPDASASPVTPRSVTVAQPQSEGERRGMRGYDSTPRRQRGGSGGEAGAAATGRVYLVGAGPGDPDLLTRRAWDVLQRVDAVLHDSLVPDRLLDELPADATVADVGKRPPDPVSQAEIHDRLVARAIDGESVARLKGGDPNVFGRGGEEAQHLADEGVPFEVVPGISSVLAAPSVAGIPLTHREHASSLTVVTGHETPEKEESALDWSALADTIHAGGTLVVLMGVSRLANYVEFLREEGVPGDTPLALVQQATWEGQQTVTSTLADAVRDATEADLQPPAVTIIGDVVAVRDRIEATMGGH